MSNATKEVYITQDGLEEIKKELQHLKTVSRPKVIEALKEARALGDLGENAEYDAARNEQAIVENKIQDLEALVETAIIISDVKTDKVSVGNKVTIEYIADKEKEEYKIVGSHEADPLSNKISNESPIAKAIIGKKVGATVFVDSPNGEYEIKVIEIA